MKWPMSLNMLNLLKSIWFLTGEKFTSQRNDSLMVTFPALVTRGKSFFFFFGEEWLEGSSKCLYQSGALNFLEDRANVKT